MSSGADGAEQAVGRHVRRKEDFRLLTGRGLFTDDLPGREGEAAMHILRSPHAHARIRSIDASAAKAMAGVLAVLTGLDALAEGFPDIPHDPLPKTRNDLQLTGPGGSEVFIGAHPLLPHDKARYAGEAIAAVVAETPALAADAAERILVDWEPLPAVADTREAAMSGSPPVWDGRADNVLVDCEFGDARRVSAAFARAAHIVELEARLPRVAGAPLEPRAAVGAFDAETGRYTLHAGSGGAVRHKGELASVLGIEPDRLRVVCGDVGGNFGVRNRVYVEFGIVLWAARLTGRPVRWVATRSEAMVSDYQGRDLVSRAALALDANGRFLALRADNISNVGARCVSLSPLGKGAILVTGSYDIPAATVRARAVFSHTAPTQAYRSSGRPEVCFVIERLVDKAARELDFDPVALRRANLVRSFPYRNALGAVYDSGDYGGALDRALLLSDEAGFPGRKTAAEARGRRYGRGVAHYVESSIGSPREQAELVLVGNGRLEVLIGTQPSGQGHETAFAQVAADALGIPCERIDVVTGDTDRIHIGGGSHSGRSMRMAGEVIRLAAQDLVEAARPLAARRLASNDIGFREGGFEGPQGRVALLALGPLSVRRENLFEPAVYPNGCHVAEVEVDPDTGAVRLARYSAVDDVGRAVNPMIVEGQTHGAAAQGLGQVLMEEVVWDEIGQPLAGSFMDYAMPRACDLPPFAVVLHEVPSPTNALGVKAGGEGGAVPAPAAVFNALADALGDADGLRMPLGRRFRPLPEKDG